MLTAKFGSFGQVVSEEKIKPEALKSLYRSPGNKKKTIGPM